ncbi:ABC transporter ATP-binding protein [Propioniciclava sinopodophylli]|uniref:ABC transporter ATP-binding protein n=1 Tax=Propioniciclava sinopodophylli TaxID=1837344 RepID=UPI00248FEC4E|nr:ABC transporter ATP-binding protein [Propioniciclava sinopodophylli]
MAPVVELADVSIVRGGATLLDQITWSIDETDRWVVIGPNGAGKTTLLQVLSANLHPTSGYASILDEVLGAVDVFELRPRIGVTSAALADRIPRSEAVGNVIVSAAYAVVGRWNEGYEVDDFRRAASLMKQLRIEHLGKRTFGTLSEGERKRVQIARALMTDPELLLLDEPGAGLDLAGRERLVQTLSEIVADDYSPATVLVTHHIEEIPPGMTHAMLLKGGQVVAAGPIEGVLTDAHMSEAFDLPLTVTQADGRWSARAARHHPERAAQE